MGCKCGGNRGGRQQRQVSTPPRLPSVTPTAPGAALPMSPSLAVDANLFENNKERRRIEQVRREQIRNALGVG